MNKLETLKKYKCQNCSKVLFFAAIVEATISKDCPKCGCRNVITVGGAAIIPFSERIRIVQKALKEDYGMSDKTMKILNIKAG